MPKSFDPACKKRYDPHFFNTANNLDYVCPYPEPKYYGADYMSGDEEAQYLESYEEHKDKIFCTKQELLANDVNVLRQSACAIRNSFFKLFKMDPIRQAIAISSICNEAFRTMFLKPGTLGIIPKGGYRMGDPQSVEALQCLAYIGRTRINVTYAGNGREVHLPGIPNVKFDGYCTQTSKVFE